MSETYNSWFRREIEQRLSEIKDFSNRINFLFDEKSRFISNNQGVEADQVILKFNNLIEKEKYLFEFNKKTSQETKPEILLDYSDNPMAERIVFLNELGILKYLHDKIENELHYFAPNKLAEIISTFTDIPQSTAQSYLNPMYSKDVDKSKSPLTDKNLKKVKKKLTDIGFSL